MKNKNIISKSVSTLYSAGEEIANSLTHGIGAVLSIVTSVLLILLAFIYGDPWQAAGFIVFGVSLFFVFLTSSIYHGVTNQRVKHIFRVLDHLAIYLLIAGTYTPVILTYLRTPLGWTLFSIVWLMAIAGIIHEVFFFGKMNSIVSVLYYVIMGGLILFAIKPLIATAPMAVIKWLMIGGASYILGLIFYAWEKMPYNHAVWHLFVIAGSVFHIIGFFHFFGIVAA